MPITQARVHFHESSGKLQAVDVRRSNNRPVISALHKALFAAGVMITTYQVRATANGLHERLELASLDGHELTDTQSESARTAILPLALDEK